jgi:hypothetical protein
VEMMFRALGLYVCSKVVVGIVLIRVMVLRPFISLLRISRISFPLGWFLVTVSFISRLVIVVMFFEVLSVSC